MKTKYIGLLIVLLFGFTACESDDDTLSDPLIDDTVSNPPTPNFTSGSADFSTFVSIGNSLTAGFSDNSLFAKGQVVSFPNLLAQRMSLAGGGDFTQPLTSDDVGGLLLNGAPISGPRLIFNPVTQGLQPASGTPSTDIANVIPGPYNNMGVPGAKSFHLLANGYGDIMNFPAAANPYFIRMASNPNASMLEDAMDLSPSFFSLWIGNNDVLGYATSGGDGSNPITDVGTFTFAMNTLVSTLTSGGAEGILANIPNVTDAPFFTTVPFAPLDPTDPDFASQIPTLNGIFGQLNQVYAFLGEPERSIVFSQTAASAVVIKDETLADLSVQIAGVLGASPTFPAFVQSLGLPAAAAPLVANLLGTAYGQSRQANESDLLILPSSSVIGEVNQPFFDFLVSQGIPATLAGQFAVEGITYALDDNWVVLPSELMEIQTATATFNSIINGLAEDNDLALFDVNTFFNGVATNGFIVNDFYTMTADFVTGGTFSLDGIHPSPRGYAVVTNQMIAAINAKYGSNLPEVNPVDYTGLYID